jgi:protein TonB
MFHPYAPQPNQLTPPRWLQEGALWLAHLGLFASLLWLSDHLLWEPPGTAAKKLSRAEPPVCQLGPALKPVPARQITDPKPSPDTDCPVPRTDDVLGNDASPWDNAIPFSSPTMIPPKLISGGKLEHTPAALAARVQGLIIAKCTITCRGEVRNCRIIKPLPHMEDAVLAALQSRRYTPVQFQGRPVSVSYLFNIRLSLP